MFSAATKLFQYVTGKYEGGDQQTASLKSPEPPPSTDNQGQSSTEWFFTGKVTGMYGAYGIIEHQVYFTIQHLDGAPMPDEGDTVQVKAKRKHGHGGWKAETVSLIAKGANNECINEWDTEDVIHVPESCGSQNDCYITAKVTKETVDGGYLGDRLPYSLTDVTYAGYIPCVGDWVKAKEVINNDDTSFAREIEPLRVLHFDGKINSVQDHSHGYIDGEIYFNCNACEGFQPRRYDLVCGKAVEVTRGRCQWRAFTVQKTSDKIDTNAVLQSPVVRKAPTLHFNLTELLQSKHGVEISEADFGQVEIGRRRMLKIWVRNRGTECQTIKNYSLQGNSSQFTVESLSPAVRHQTDDKKMSSTNRVDRLGIVVLQPGRAVVVNAECNARNLGCEQTLFICQFDDFKIGCMFRVRVRDDKHGVLDPSSPYQRFKGSTRPRNNPDSWVVPGQRPARSAASIKLPNRLRQFPVPPVLRDWVDDPEKDITLLAPALAEHLCLENYGQRFSTLLHLEEIQEDIDIREFDLERTCLRCIGEFLALQVPGLAEGRPSVLIGDRVILSTPHSQEHGPEYEGFVHEVLRDEVLLKFHQAFHSSYCGEDYHVRFSYNRTPLRRCHSAVQFAPDFGEEVLFPKQLLPKIPQTKITKNSNMPKSKPNVVPVSGSVGVRHCPLGVSIKNPAKLHSFHNKSLNDRQRAAVLRILNGQSRPTPYILFGPPGTGKTVTVVEAVLQIFQHLPSSRIIVCTPSNSAADLLTERLHESGLLKESDMIRLNAFRRSEGNIVDSIRPYCSDGSDLENVSRHRVLVCTCISAGQMYTLGLQPGHFTHVFIDEAGQATEPECLIAAGLVAGSAGQIVLAGDPMQLGPVLRSTEAKAYGLGISWLERLSLTPLYSRDEQRFCDHGSYDPLLVTKLIENYRSHSAILSVPSQCFYHNELLVSAPEELTNCLIKWPDLINKKNFPVIFHGIRSQDMREGSSPSWFNPMEALQVMRYLQSLVSNTEHPLTWDDIGVITPYRKQVEKIRLLIDKLGMERVKVGSTEEFQGQERLVMIISTVRSTEGEIGSDVRHNLGFLSNPKRFNVAVTRAQALLIIIGNPHVLEKDPYWRIILQYCVTNRAYTGCDLPHEIDPPQEDIALDEAPSLPVGHQNVSSDHIAQVVDTEKSSLLSKAGDHMVDNGLLCRDEDDISKMHEQTEEDDIITSAPGSCTVVERTKENVEESQPTSTVLISDNLVDVKTSQRGIVPESSQDVSIGEVNQEQIDIEITDERKEIQNHINEEGIDSVSGTAILGRAEATASGDGEAENNGSWIRTLIDDVINTTDWDSLNDQVANSQKIKGLENTQIRQPEDRDSLHPYNVNEQYQTGLSHTFSLENLSKKLDAQQRTMQNILALQSKNRSVSPKDDIRSNGQDSANNDITNSLVSTAEITTQDESMDNSDLRRSNDESPEEPDEELEHKIIRQLEYYFGDINLLKDKFLREEMEKDPGKYVKLSVIMTFNRMKALTPDMIVIANALRKSANGIVEVHKSGAKVRRNPNRPLPHNLEDWQADLRNRAVAAEGLPINMDIDTAQKFFERIGAVEHVERGIRKLNLGNSVLSCADLIIFSTSGAARKLYQEGKNIFKDEKMQFYHRDKLCNFCLQYFYRTRIRGLKPKRYRSNPRRFNNTNIRQNSKNGQQKPPSDIHRYGGNRSSSPYLDQQQQSDTVVTQKQILPLDEVQVKWEKSSSWRPADKVSTATSDYSGSSAAPPAKSPSPQEMPVVGGITSRKISPIGMNACGRGMRIPARTNQMSPYSRISKPISSSPVISYNSMPTNPERTLEDSVILGLACSSKSSHSPPDVTHILPGDPGVCHLDSSDIVCGSITDEEKSGNNKGHKESFDEEYMMMAVHDSLHGTHTHDCPNSENKPDIGPCYEDFDKNKQPSSILSGKYPADQVYGADYNLSSRHSAEISLLSESHTLQFEDMKESEMNDPQGAVNEDNSDSMSSEEEGQGLDRSLYESLEQRDSDVIIESEEEEILETDD